MAQDFLVKLIGLNYDLQDYHFEKLNKANIRICL